MIPKWLNDWEYFTFCRTATSYSHWLYYYSGDKERRANQYLHYKWCLEDDKRIDKAIKATYV